MHAHAREFPDNASHFPLLSIPDGRSPHTSLARRCGGPIPPQGSCRAARPLLRTQGKQQREQKELLDDCKQVVVGMPAIRRSCVTRSAAVLRPRRASTRGRWRGLVHPSTSLTGSNEMDGRTGVAAHDGGRVLQLCGALRCTCRRAHRWSGRRCRCRSRHGCTTGWGGFVVTVMPLGVTSAARAWVRAMTASFDPASLAVSGAPAGGGERVAG